MSKLFTGNSIRDFSVNKSGSNITIAKFYSSGESGIFHSNDYGNSFELDPNFINVNAYSIHQVGETEFVSLGQISREKVTKHTKK